MNEHFSLVTSTQAFTFLNSISHHTTKCNYYLESSLNAEITLSSWVKKSLFTLSHQHAKYDQNLNDFATTLDNLILISRSLALVKHCYRSSIATCMD